jgi:DNA mismatch endonuclease, patch repair protein
VTDIVDPATRSRMMSAIRGKDTKPEILVRKGLHSKGFRYRLHVAHLPGKPDIVLSKYRAVVMINGCFWHRHNCNMFHWPKSNRQFWRKKLNRNAKVDKKNIDTLLQEDWRVQVIWECALRGQGRLPETMLMNRIARWIKSKTRLSEIEGRQV